MPMKGMAFIPPCIVMSQTSIRSVVCCRCCTFDNRGIGSSSIPEHLSAYKTGIMAADVRALMDHLGWRKAHIMGMSLGGESPCVAMSQQCLFRMIYHQALQQRWCREGIPRLLMQNCR